jgi:hypothetical protein
VEVADAKRVNVLDQENQRLRSFVADDALSLVAS